VKPDNILISHCGVGVLCDFGLALQLGDDSMIANLVDFAPVGGNPPHLAPEVRFSEVQQNIRRVSYKHQPSWELGVLFCETTLGICPFVHDMNVPDVPDVHARAQSVQQAHPEMKYPPEFLDLILRCLNEPDQRPSVAEICSILESIVPKRVEKVDVGPFNIPQESIVMERKETAKVDINRPNIMGITARSKIVRNP
jgi:serine/threonine protein kinase